MSEPELNVDIPNEAGWPIQSVDSLCSLISRGTAPVYVENSEVLAIGQRCVTSTEFAPAFARPHSHHAMGNVLRPEFGDVLLNSTGTGTIGRSVVFNSPGAFIVDGHVTVMRPRAELADSRWLNSVLRTPPLQRHLERFCFAGSTNQLELSRTPLRVSRLPTPHIDDQRAMGLVIDTLDIAIHETEAIVAKLKAVKRGLLYDLLTRGIDANGELRPSQIKAPHLYKESPLGWIPTEWDVIRVGEDAEIEHGFAFAGHQFTDKEIGPALLVPGNFHREGGLYFTSENTKYFSGKYPQQYLLSHGDVLVVMTDLSPMTLILGRTVVLTQTFKVLHNQRIGKFRFKKDGLWDTTFFAESLSQDAVRLKVIAEATGTTVRHTSPDRIKNCYVARPKLHEQQMAAQRIAIVDARRKLEEANLLKLKHTKAGLMDDLLTGRVRVTPLHHPDGGQNG